MNGNLISQLQTYSDHIVYKQMMEKTGINIDFVHPAAGQDREEFSIMMASTELPDIIQSFSGYYSGGLTSAYDDGVIVDLTDYVKEYAPDYYALISKDEETYRQFTRDGKILCFSTYWEELNPTAACITLRQDWLEEFGLQAEDMTTYEAIEAYFEGIKTNYPDVAPFYLNVGYEYYYYGFNIFPNWYQENGRAVYYDSGDQAKYRSWLELMNRWYDKGYISPDFASYKPEEARALFSAGMIGCFGEPIGNVYSDSDASGLRIVKSPWWRQTENAAINVYFPEGIERYGGQDTVITTQCENIEEAVKLLNYCYTDAGMDLTNFGIEELCYTVDENGTKTYTDLVINNPDKLGTAVTHQLYRIHWIPNRKLADTTANPNITKRQDLVDGRLLYAAGDPTMDGAYYLPGGAFLTAEESAERSSIMNNVDTYLKEMRLKFITGVEKITDESWQSYLSTLEQFGLSKAEGITQAAYDRYMGK
jgi:ABC-type sugar transport system, periplasmic component